MFHHLFAAPILAAYPDAELSAPKGLRAKRSDLRIDHELGEKLPAAWGSALTAVHVDGSMLDETVLFHADTGSVISSDLLEYFEQCDETWTRLYLKAAGVYQRPTWNRFLRLIYRDRKAARRSIDRILEWPITQVVIGHGDVVTKDAHSAVRESFVWLK